MKRAISNVLNRWSKDKPGSWRYAVVFGCIYAVVVYQRTKWGAGAVSARPPASEVFLWQMNS
jgi:hypothetical protein